MSEIKVRKKVSCIWFKFTFVQEWSSILCQSYTLVYRNWKTFVVADLITFISNKFNPFDVLYENVFVSFTYNPNGNVRFWKVTNQTYEEN